MARIVFILGAGASSAAGAPLMKNFVNTARDLFGDTRRPVASVFTAMAALARSQAKATIDLQNIEEVFSAFELGSLVERLGDLPADTIRKLPEAVAELIARTLEHTIDRYQVVKLREKVAPGYPVARWEFRPDLAHLAFAALVQVLMEASHEVAILTFNYDVSVEVALDHTKTSYSYELPDTPHESKGRKSPVRILKLHGSLNWAKCDCGQIHTISVSKVVSDFMASREIQGIFAKTDREDVRLPIFDLVANNASCEGKSRRVFIVPPTWNKMGYYSEIRPVWRSAVDALKDADNIIVIGYSWPPTDHFFSYLYALGTAGDTLLRRFIVLDPSEETIQRYRAMLGQQAVGVFTGMRAKFEIDQLTIIANEFGSGKEHQARTRTLTDA